VIGVEVILVALALGMDAMSVCMGIGVKWHGRRQKFRMAWHMGLFQCLMPLLGYLCGTYLAGLLSTWGSRVAGALVIVIGAKMGYEALKSHPGGVAEEIEREVEQVTHHHPKDPTRGWSLIVLSVATSIDALVVGVSLALRGAEIWLSSVVIGLVAAAMALAGIAIGRRIGEYLGRWAEVAGAAVLMGLGVYFIVF
jgi:putative Mn2+ efflux pump MntP